MIKQLTMRLTSGAIGFATLSVLTLNLDYSEFGLYAKIMTLITCSLPLAHLAIPTAILQQDSKIALLTIFKNKFFFYYSIYLLIFVLTYWYILNSWLEFHKFTTYFFLLNLIAFSLFEILSATLVRCNHAIKTQFVTLIIRPALYVISIYTIFKFEANLNKVLLLHLFVLIACTSILLFFALKIVKTQEPQFYPLTEVKIHAGITSLIFLSFLQIVLRNAEILVASYSLNLETIGTLKVITSFSIFIPSFVALINAKSSQVMKEKLDNGDISGLKKIIKKNEKEMVMLSIGYSLIAILTLAFFGEKFFAINFGDHYFTIIIIFGSQIIFSKFGSRGYALLLAKKQIVLLQNIAFSITILVLSMLALQLDTIEKVAIAVSICTMILVWKNKNQYQKLIGALK